MPSKPKSPRRISTVNSGFSLTIPLIRRFVGGLVYGDQLMLLSNQIKPYEVNHGETMALVSKWTDRISDLLSEGKGYTLEEIDEMDKWEGAQLNTAKEILATELTTLVHGSDEAAKAKAGAEALFSAAINICNAFKSLHSKGLSY